MSFVSGGNMTDSRSSSGRLFVLDLSGGRIFSLNHDGSEQKTLVTGCRLPDGLAVDSAVGCIYWTNVGVPHRNDGSIERAYLDGGNRRFIIPEGARSRQNNFISKRRVASSIGRTARVCA
jgi:hypothetical protein